MTDKSDTDFMKVLEKGIRDVLDNKKTTAKERIEAIKVGAQVMQIKHKISDPSDEPGSFFK